MQPGTTIVPGGQPPEAPTPPPPQPEPQPPVVNSQPETPSVPDQPAGWSYQQDATPDTDPAPTNASHDTVTWRAAEYISHDKSPAWFATLAGAAIILSVLGYLLSRDFVTPIVIIVAVILFGVSAARPPRTLDYLIDDKGITVGPKHYGYNQFKSFGVHDEGSSVSIVLVPTKRFMPPLSVYYPVEMEEQIVTKIGDYLPFQHHESDYFEMLMRKIRF